MQFNFDWLNKKLIYLKQKIHRQETQCSLLKTKEVIYINKNKYAITEQMKGVTDRSDIYSKG